MSIAANSLFIKYFIAKIKLFKSSVTISGGIFYKVVDNTD